MRKDDRRPGPFEATLLVLTLLAAFVSIGAGKGCNANDVVKELCPPPGKLILDPTTGNLVCKSPDTTPSTTLPPTTTTTTLPPSTLPPASPPPVESPIPPIDHGAEVGQGGVEEPSQFLDQAGVSDVNRAIDEACGRCEGGSKVLDWQAFLSAIRAQLGRRGYITNYDWDHGDQDASLPGPYNRYDSELSIWKRDGCRIESYQVVTSARVVRRPPSAYRSWGVFKNCPGPEPSPPAPTPHPPGECPLTVSVSGEQLRAKIKIIQQASLWLDATFEYDYGRNPETNEGLGPCLDQYGKHRRWCDLGVDDAAPGHEKCPPAIIGIPQWSSKTVEIEPGFHGTYSAKVWGGHGEVKVCSQFFEASCGTVMIP